MYVFVFFFQAEDGIRDLTVTGVQTCALPISEATSVAFPGLSGVLPGFGRQEHNDWGLGFEIRDAKSPHWTGSRNSPRTFGHFGQSGSFLWVDPDAGLACVSLADENFGDWARQAWPKLSDDLIAAYGA